MPSDFGTRGRVPAAALDSLAPGRASRAQVLLALGEPDRAWRGERYFYYRWTTIAGYWMWMLAGGYQGAGGLVVYGERQHDLVFEFDADGRLRRRASLRTWLTPDGSGEPGDSLELPVQLRPGHLHAGGPAPALLTLDRDELRFSDVSRGRHDARIAPRQVETIRFKWFQQLPRSVERVGCELTFADDGRHRRKLRLVLAPEDALTLLEYARLACPWARVID